jgi:hypothetical protein
LAAAEAVTAPFVTLPYLIRNKAIRAGKALRML